MRLFVAIHVPDGVRTAIASLLDEFRLIDREVKWIKPENLHVTLKFLGRTDANQLASIVEILSTLGRSAHPITLNFVGLGFFPNAMRPNVLWTGIQVSANVQSIVQDIDQRLGLLGFPVEEREFTPHVTLARFDGTALSRNLQNAIERNASRPFGGFTATDFHLIQSTLKSSGAEYTILHSFSFMAEG